MNFKSERNSLIILGVTSLVFTRGMFWFFDDPEGPNLLIVVGMAGAIYLMSLVVYSFNWERFNKLLLTIAVQLVIVTILYFALS